MTPPTEGAPSARDAEALEQAGNVIETMLACPDPLCQKCRDLGVLFLHYLRQRREP